MKKRLLTAVLATILILSLAACGDNNVLLLSLSNPVKSRLSSFWDTISHTMMVWFTI